MSILNLMYKLCATITIEILYLSGNTNFNVRLLESFFLIAFFSFLYYIFFTSDKILYNSSFIVLFCYKDNGLKKAHLFPSIP